MPLKHSVKYKNWLNQKLKKHDSKTLEAIKKIFAAGGDKKYMLQKIEKLFIQDTDKKVEKVK